jgi:hypothetical protein
MGSLVAAAEAQGYGRASAEGQAPFHGYFYRILTRQGQDALPGAQDDVVDGHLIRGLIFSSACDLRRARAIRMQNTNTRLRGAGLTFPAPMCSAARNL